jgi:hypothetical protein
MFFEQDRASRLFEQAADDDEQRSISAALDAEQAISVACLVPDDGEYVRLSLTAQPAGDGGYAVTTSASYDVPVSPVQADNAPLVDVLVGEDV